MMRKSGSNARSKSPAPNRSNNNDDTGLSKLQQARELAAQKARERALQRAQEIKAQSPKNKNSPVVKNSPAPAPTQNTTTSPAVVTNKVAISNLPKNCDEEMIRAFFDDLSPFVRDVRWGSNKESVAYVEFAQIGHAHLALEKSGKKLGGKKVLIELDVPVKTGTVSLAERAMQQAEELKKRTELETLSRKKSPMKQATTTPPAAAAHEDDNNDDEDAEQEEEIPMSMPMKNGKKKTTPTKMVETTEMVTAKPKSNIFLIVTSIMFAITFALIYVYYNTINHPQNLLPGSSYSTALTLSVASSAIDFRILLLGMIAGGILGGIISLLFCPN